jgi:hypothetical protein
MTRSLQRSLLLALCLFPARLSAEAEQPYKLRPKGTLTFNKDIAPGMFRHCTTCHRPGEVAPFSLLTYKDVKKRLKQIVQVVEDRFMPPWKPVPGHGAFRGARRLTAEQIGMLKQWAAEGAAEGDPKDLPAAPGFPDGWQLGKPDLVITLPKPYTVPASGADVYRNFVLPFAVPEGKYIQAVEYRPSNRRVVHHAVLSLDATGKLRERDGKDGSPGFSQSSFAGQLLPGNLGFWVPGKDARPLPEGVALAWPRGADLVVQLHLHPSGKPEVEQSTLGFYLTSTPPRRRLDGFVINYKKIDIPAGQKDYRIKQAGTLGADVEVYGIFPHMHLIGKEVKVTAILPTGAKKSLLWIDSWDFNWQGYYEYAKPVPLPKGTQVVMECVHDNSADNPSNPNQPPKRVTWGEQTTNEMAIVLLHTLPAPGSPQAGAPRDFDREAKELIRRYDSDGDGKLDLAELEKIPGAAGKDVKKILQRFDADGDGKLDAAEVAAALKALAKR